MQAKWWLAVAISAAALAGPGARADLFERFGSREAKFDHAADIPSPLSFAVADKSEIGKIVSPVAYQPLPAPAADGRLVPVPESHPIGPAPGYYPTGPYSVERGPVVGAPIVGHPTFGPGYPVGPEMSLDGYPLYHRVEYEDFDHIHPCAVPTVVQVLDPCTVEDDGCCLFGHRRHHDACDACHSCGPRCVYVKICVPPGCPKVKVSRDGRKVKYDFGDYKVEVESKDGHVEVDYDD